MAERLRYPGDSVHQARLVELPNANEAVAATPGILSIIAAGYRLQFETGGGDGPRVARRTVYNRYSPRLPANVRRFSKRLGEHCRQGAARLAIVHADTGMKDYQGYAKVGPADRCTDGLFNSGYYLYDVISREHHQGTGSVALHAVLKHTGFSPDAPLVCEAFVGSPVNTWYEDLGMEARPDLPADDFDFCDGVHKLPMVWYATPGTAGIGDLVAALESRSPRLAEAERL